MVRRNLDRTTAEFDDFEKGVVDFSEKLSVDDFMDEVDDIEGRVDILVNRLLSLKGQIKSLKRLRFYPNHS